METFNWEEVCLLTVLIQLVRLYSTLDLYFILLVLQDCDMEDRNKKLYFKKRIRNTRQSDIHVQFSRIVIEFF